MSNINPPPQRLPPKLAGDPALEPFFREMLRAIYLIFERVRWLDLEGVRITSGTGTPESAVVGSVGDVFLRTDGGSGTTMYVKESGTGTNTGWAAV